MEQNVLDLSLSLKKYEPETYIESLERDIFSIIIENFKESFNAYHFNSILHMFFLRICYVLFENISRRDILKHRKIEYNCLYNKKKILFLEKRSDSKSGGVDGPDGSDEDVEEINLNDILFENYFRKNPLELKISKKVTFNYNFLVYFYDTIPNEREITYESEKINRQIAYNLHHTIGKDTTTYYRWDDMEIINLLLSYLY